MDDKPLTDSLNIPLAAGDIVAVGGAYSSEFGIVKKVNLNSVTVVWPSLHRNQENEYIVYQYVVHSLFRLLKLRDEVLPLLYTQDVAKNLLILKGMILTGKRIPKTLSGNE